MNISAPVIIARLVLQGASDEEIRASLCQDADALSLFESRLAEVARMRAMLSHVDHASERDIAGIARQFDQAVTCAPEASVASYSLGDSALLEAATSEVVGWLRNRRLFLGGMDVLDVGCGFGRVAAALAHDARSVLGIDISPRMIEEARRRCAGIPRLDFAVTSGTDLAEMPAAGFDLILAVDSFPYLFQAGTHVARRHIEDAARVLRPDGTLVILNLAYGDDRRAEAIAFAAKAALRVEVEGICPFELWDGEVFVFRRASSA